MEVTGSKLGLCTANSEAYLPVPVVRKQILKLRTYLTLHHHYFLSHFI